MGYIAVLFGGLIFVIVLLMGLVIWSSQDFADRCERAGGVNIDYEVCVPAGTPILMTS